MPFCTADILRRVSIVIHQHIQRCEQRLSVATPETFEKGLFRASQMEKFSEELFTSPQYVYHFVRAPLSRLGFLYGIRKLSKQYSSPSLSEVHTFLSDLFVKAQLSAECSIGIPLSHSFGTLQLTVSVVTVCLIYVERLMESANVPIVGKTWRPCLLCGLLLASKVWQDLGYGLTYLIPPFHDVTVSYILAGLCVGALAGRGTARSHRSTRSTRSRRSTS